MTDLEQHNGPASQSRDWWRTAVIYQVYPRSFADSNGDGIGDIEGIINHLDYISDLGVDAIWVSPFFTSPQDDFGYDISNYCDIAPEYGSLADAERLIDETHSRGMKIIFDSVLNHTSEQHPWFLDSRNSRDSEHADWYIWRDGRGIGGKRRPNNWRAGLEVKSAWHWGEERQQWYLGTFLPWQPDLNWRNPEVRDAMWAMTRFWLDRGVDGFRLDMFGSIMKDPGFRDNPIRPRFGGTDFFRFWDRKFTDNTEDNFDLARQLRSVCVEYSPQRVLLGEVFGSPATLRKYLGNNDGLQLTFLFDFLAFRYSAKFFRNRIEAYEANYSAPFLPTYVFENHDRSRSLSRAGGDPRRARVLATLLLTLRGVPTIYQGQEIGMTNTYIPLRNALDPVAKRYFSWFPEVVSRRLPERINRDEVRTPMQWDGSNNAGFSNGASEPWLRPNPNYISVNVNAQDSDPRSLLNWYRTLLNLRSTRTSLHSGDLRLIDGLPEDILAYRRSNGDEQVRVFLNFSESRKILPISPGATILASSDPANSIVNNNLGLEPNSSLVVG